MPKGAPITQERRIKMLLDEMYDYYILIGMHGEIPKEETEMEVDIAMTDKTRSNHRTYEHTIRQMHRVLGNILD